MKQTVFRDGKRTSFSNDKSDEWAHDWRQSETTARLRRNNRFSQDYIPDADADVEPTNIINSIMVIFSQRFVISNLETGQRGSRKPWSFLCSQSFPSDNTMILAADAFEGDCLSTDWEHKIIIMNFRAAMFSSSSIESIRVNKKFTHFHICSSHFCSWVAYANALMNVSCVLCAVYMDLAQRPQDNSSAYSPCQWLKHL